MKKIGIVTIDSINFGNRLQNYALQRTLLYLGLDVYTIPRKAPIDSLSGRLGTGIKRTARKICRTRGGLYTRFNDKYIRYSSKYVTADTYSAGIDSQFDYFIAGSDQVWNPIYADLPHKPVGINDFLVFARPEQKISYAASFGVTEIPESKKELFQNALKDFRAISVREEAGAKIVKDLIGRDATVVVDPTLLLSVEHWRKIEHSPKIVRKPYIMVYSLGGWDTQLKKAIDEVGEERIIDVMGVDKSGRCAPYGPQEFLYLIDHSEEVWTNSFHAMVFSLLFHKTVRIFPRKDLDMSSRIVSLANLTGMVGCFGEEGVFIAGKDTDYKTVDERIDIAKQKSLKFLKNALDV